MENIVNIIEDVSLLTDVSENLLRKLSVASTYSIGHALHEAQCRHESCVDVDLEIGTLSIKFDDTGIRYRFIPSKELEQLLLQTVKTKSSPIALKLEKNLQEKIERTYKDLL